MKKKESKNGSCQSVFRTTGLGLLLVSIGMTLQSASPLLPPDTDGKGADSSQCNMGLQNLKEVVVVGYSTSKKVNLSGAVSSLNADELSSRPVNNLSTVLQGLVSGVK